MRKDLKIGLAIGAVLLTLLIVYVVVPKGGDDGVVQSGGAGDAGSEAVTPSGDTGTSTPADTGVASGSTTSTPDETANVGVKPDPFDDKSVGKESTGSTEIVSSAGGDVWATALEKGELPVRTTTPPSLSAVSTEKPANGAKTSEPKSTGTESTKAKPEGDAAPLVSPLPEGSAKKSGGETVSGATPRTHKIQRGETFSKIADMIYGNEKYYLKIEEANPGVDPSRLKPGMVINLPDVSATKAKTSVEPSAPSADASQKKLGDDEYRVASNDSLYKIAMKKYGSSNMVDAIYEANKSTIGDDPAKLKIDMVLKLPKNSSETPAR